MKPRHIPERTCIGCRTRAPASELVRVLAVEGRIVVTPPGRRPPGRGAWLHPRAGCVAAACKTRAFGRAFRAAVVTPPFEALLAELTR